MKFTHENDFNDLVNAAAKKYNVDPAIIKGVIAQESNFIKTAYRFEPYLSPKTGKPRSFLAPSADFPNGGGASLGLMQVLVSTARAMGFKGPMEGLYDPATAIDYGTRFLSNLIYQYTKQGKPLDNALSAYNGGSSGDVAAFGPFSNQAYVDNVNNYISYFQTAGSDGEQYYSEGDVASGADDNSWLDFPTDWEDVPNVPLPTAIGGSAILFALALGAVFLLKKK